MPEERPLNRHAFQLSLVLAIAMLGAALPGCEKHDGNEGTVSQTPAAPIDLRVIAPSRATIPRTVRVTGTFFGDEEATIASKVSGRVVETPVDLGDRVGPDEVLVRIDPVDYTLARDERRRALAEALSRLGLAELPPESAPFDPDAVPLVRRAIVEEENARIRFERARQLAEAEQPLMGPQEFSDIRTAYEVARSDVAVQRLNAQTLLALARTLEVQLRIAEQRLADTEPRAPGAGPPGSGGAAARSYLVAQRSVSVGDFVQVGTPLIRLVAADPVKLRVNVPERRFGEIAPGQKVTVHADSNVGGDPVRAEVSRVAPALNIETRTLPVEIVIDNPDLRLKPGGFATAEILVGTSEATIVPRSAVLTFAGVHKVITVVDGVAQEKRVTLGQTVGMETGEWIEVLSGLDGGETIAASPPASIATGARVRILSDE